LAGRRTRLRLLEPGHHVGARRYHGPRGGLAGESGTRLRPQWRSGGRRSRRCGNFLGGHRRGSSRHRRRGKRDGCRRYRSGGRHGLPGTRQNLTRTGRGNGTRRYGTRAQRGMQRRCATRGQWRPQGRRLAAKRFFKRGNGSLLRRNRVGRFNNGCGWFCGGRRTFGYRLGTRGFLNDFGLCDGGPGLGFRAHRHASTTLHALPDLLGDVFVNGAGMSFLLGDTELGQHVENCMRWDFELPRQLVDSDFRHK